MGIIVVDYRRAGMWLELSNRDYVSTRFGRQDPEPASFFADNSESLFV